MKKEDKGNFTATKEKQEKHKWKKETAADPRKLPATSVYYWNFDEC